MAFVGNGEVSYIRLEGGSWCTALRQALEFVRYRHGCQSARARAAAWVADPCHKTAAVQIQGLAERLTWRWRPEGLAPSLLSWPAWLSADTSAALDGRNSFIGPIVTQHAEHWLSRR